MGIKPLTSVFNSGHGASVSSVMRTFLLSKGECHN